jgi:hypothetical protein
MQSHAVDENAILSTQELKEMASAAGPCISMYIPVAPTGVDRREQSVRFKTALNEVTELLNQRGSDQAQISTLLAPIKNIADREEYGGGKSVALFRSPDLFRQVSLPWEIGQSIVVGDHFQIRPLLGLLHKPKSFYILALSQKHIQLLRGKNDSLEEVELPQSFPRDLQEWIATDKPDHVLDNRSKAGPSVGSMQGVMFGTNSDQDKKDEYLLHFYKAVDRSLHDLLKDDPAPVVLAGVEYELALYHRVSKYPHLMDDGVHGAQAQDIPKGVDLRQRALEFLDAQGTQSLENVLALYDKQSGSRISTDLAGILKAAQEGRVAHLLLADDVDASECFNVAALQTLLSSGQVHLVPRGRMPGGGAMSALLRY